MTRFRSACAAVALAVVASSAQATITSFNQDFAGWEAAAGTYATCDFTGFPEWTYITDQYQALGVTFTNPTPNVVKLIPPTFPLDGWGIDANGYLELTFAEPMHAIGGHVPGKPYIQLFLGDTLIGQVPPVLGAGPSNFAGAVSDIGFDRVRFQPLTPPPSGQVFIDNVYFSPVPSPAGVGVFALAALVAGRRQRR